ncbi:MAG: DUF3306 domain-containing protein [Polynucleobacter sp.]|nr:DUF3306 domain-containing protein [Polynucleobacter sp.]
MADGFLGRWSRRKAGLEPEGLDGSAPELKPKTAPSAVPQDKKTVESAPAPAEEEVLPPTLEDAESIDRFAPDFSAFMKPNVDPAVQQAAMKKLFSDPHFNIMDRLDIYIDDYSIPDPIPMEMLKRMVQSETLGLFRTFEEGPGAKVLAESEEEKAREPEPATAAEPEPAQIADASAGDVTMPQDEDKVDVPNPDLDQTVASFNIVPEQKIK